MPASSAVSGFGTLLKIGDGGGSEVFTTIAEVRDVQGPGITRTTFDTTNMNSPGGWMEKAAGLIDAGQVTFNVNWLVTDSTQNYTAGLLHDMVNGTKRNFRITWPNAGATNWTFAAFITGYNPNAPLNDALRNQITLTVTGQPTLAG